MLQILSRTRNIWNNRIILAVKNKATNQNGYAQFNKRTTQCVFKPKIFAGLRSMSTSRKQLTALGWGISGIIICGLIMYVDKSCLLLAVVPLVLFHHQQLFTICKMLPRDVRFITKYAQAKYISGKIVSDNWTLHKLFKRTVETHANKMMLSKDGHEWKYNEMNRYVNRVTRLLQKHGLSKGDVVCLMLGNSPEMIGIMLGASQIGVIGALINVNLKMNGLKHCIDISKCSIMIVDKDHVDVVDEIMPTLDNKIKFYQLDGKPKNERFASFEEEVIKEKYNSPEVIMEPKWDDPLLYIYTSGTSGVPKAAIISHSKFLVHCLYGTIFLSLNSSNDKIYNPLPLYHGTGLVLGTGPAITTGVPVVIRQRFSSQNYITECNKFNCTVGMYVGEICRFIYLKPPADTDTKHKLRLLYGNGLNNELWQSFQTRFKIPKITEFYGQTEGNCNMLNIDGKVGAVGFLPLIAPFKLYPHYLVKINNETLEPIRDANGICIKCKYDEPGMLVGRIRNRVPESQYLGYAHRETDSKANIIKDVFQKGDLGFLSRDILVMDKYQYFYFKDRTGDSFRWRGENVSSNEVEGVVMGIIHKPCACFGVKIKSVDGYPGMVCIEDPSKSIDISNILPKLMHHLPKYAIPRFIRIVDKIEMTGSHKIIKGTIAKEGINMDIIKDQVYYLDKNSKNYLTLTKEIKDKIENGKIELY